MWVDPDDILGEMSDDELLDYIKKYRDFIVVGADVVDSTKDDKDFLQDIVYYILTNHCQRTFIISKEELIERFTEIVENNYNFINKYI